jgi:hypothetical protein
MIPKLAKWTLLWMVSVRAPRRFYYRRTLWYIIGIAVACFRHSKRKVVQVAPPDVLIGKKTGQAPS